MIVAKNISGWQWDTLEEFQVDCNKGDSHFGLPKDGRTTTACMNPKESKDSRGNTLFYYVGENAQVREFMGDPSNFDINIETPDQQ